MPGLTKKRHTNTIQMTFTGPANNIKNAIKVMKGLNFTEVSDSIPWREAYSDHIEQELTGRALRGARNREGMTQVQLAKQTNIPQRHISEMENGKRPIGKKNAKLIAEALNTNYKVFL